MTTADFVKVLHYLARYTHRVAISNHRLLNVSDNAVTFRWKDYAHHGKSRAMTLTHEEFLRRFLQHVLPTGFPRIRYFGFLANRRRGVLLPLCRQLLALDPRLTNTAAPPGIHPCPSCGAPMRAIKRLTAAELIQVSHRLKVPIDSSSQALSCAALSCIPECSTTRLPQRENKLLHHCPPLLPVRVSHSR